MRFPFRKTLEQITPYSPGKPIEEVQREFGLKEVVKLASNENPMGPSPLAVEAMKAELAQSHLYPESDCYYLRHKLARSFGLPPEYFLFGDGSDEIVALMAYAYLEPGLNIVCSEAAFVRYEMGAQTMAAETRSVPLKDWNYDVDAILKAIDARTRFVFIANPQNPVGTAANAGAFKRLVEAVPASCMVVMDEAYYEFACADPDYPRSVDYMAAHENLVLLRTFSKAYGLAGLRVGYGIARPEVWDPVDRVRPPFNVNRIAQAGALAAMDDKEHLERVVANNETGKRFLYAEFEKLGLQYVPTLANFILFDCGRPARPVFDALLRMGVICRPMGMYKLPNHLRVTIGLPEENRIFVDALRRVLGSINNG